MVAPENIKKYENLHIVFWLIKDSCWMLELRWLGILMIIPTLTIALLIAFVTRKTVEDEDGVVHEIEQDASGEAWEGGPVVLSWEDAQMTDGTDAYNVVIHEFAHKIDLLTGDADKVGSFRGTISDIAVQLDR